MNARAAKRALAQRVQRHISVQQSASAMIEVTKQFSNTLTLAENSDRRQGYLIGYKLGRAKLNMPDLSRVTHMFRDGAIQGHKDGRGHRTKLYK